MGRRRPLGLALFAGAAAGGAVLGYLAERRTVAAGAESDPEWAALLADPPGEVREVVASDGTRLRVREAGPARAPVIVLAHSYAMSSAVWLYQLRDLSDEFRVVAYDLRGHGDSGPSPGRDYGAAALGRDLADVIEATAGGRTVVAAGHSMGGMAIMALAQEFPTVLRDRLAGAVLVNTASSRLVWRGLLSAGAAAAGTVEQAVRGRGPRGSRGLPGVRATDLTYLLTRTFALTGEASPAHVAFVEQQLAASRTDVMAAFARTLGTLDLDDALAHLDVPVLVVAGERDRLTPGRQSRSLTAALPDARLVELAGVGHFAPLEAPEAVTAHLREHARALSGGGRGGARASNGERAADGKRAANRKRAADGRR